MLQVVGAGGVPSPYRTFLEMALQNVTPAEGVFAEMARVRSLTRVCETSVAGQRLAKHSTYV
jgi:hypothetical protein